MYLSIGRIKKKKKKRTNRETWSSIGRPIRFIERSSYNYRRRRKTWFSFFRPIFEEEEEEEVFVRTAIPLISRHLHDSIYDSKYHMQLWSTFTHLDLTKSCSSSSTDIQFATNRNTREWNARNVLTPTIDYIETLSPVDYAFSLLFFARIDSLHLLLSFFLFYFNLYISSFRSKKDNRKKMWLIGI